MNYRQLRKYISRDYLYTDTAILLYLAVAKLVLHLLSNTQYGFHRDEFLYLAMGDHLAWGFREVPPSIAWFGWLTTSLAGDSLFVVRLLPALLGSLTVVLTGFMARNMGGGRFAMTLSAIAVIVAPVFLRSGTLFQPVVFNQFYWTLAFYAFVELARYPGTRRWWLLIGVTAGLGLLNKYTFLLWCGGFALGLLLSPQRRLFLKPWPWLAAAIAFVMVWSNIRWQTGNNWPLFQHLEQLSTRQLVQVSRADFLREQIMMLHPATALIWLCGIYFFLRSKGALAFRAIGWTYVFSLAVLLYTGGKPYYLAPAYPALFAGGSILLERQLLARRLYWLKPVFIISLMLNGFFTMPYGTSVLPVHYLEIYCSVLSRYAGLDAPLRTETGKLGRIPQDYADMFGWKNQVQTTAEVYAALSAEEQRDCVILTGNYGEAGAQRYYGRKLDLPPAISFHSSFYDWGPGEKPGEVVIAYGIPLDALKKYFGQIRRQATISHPFALDSENQLPVYVCRKPVKSLQEAWPELRAWQ